MPRNVEFKARVFDLADVRARLLELAPVFAGEDRQRDTYFHAAHGRLKLREGTVETALIHYARPDTPGLKPSAVTLYAPSDAPALRAVLEAALGVDGVVEKVREIYYVGHVKVHLDTVPGLGTFVEVEAIDTDGSRSDDALHADALQMQAALGLSEAVYEARSYSDLLRERG